MVLREGASTGGERELVKGRVRGNRGEVRERGEERERREGRDEKGGKR